MGETLAETRVEIAARRADNERTASKLDARVRHALDVKARFRENPHLHRSRHRRRLPAGRRSCPHVPLRGSVAPIRLGQSRPTTRCRRRCRPGSIPWSRGPGRSPRGRGTRWWRSCSAGATTRSRTRRHARSWPGPWWMGHLDRRGQPGRRRRQRRLVRSHARRKAIEALITERGPFRPAKVAAASVVVRNVPAAGSAGGGGQDRATVTADKAGDPSAGYSRPIVAEPASLGSR